jgi:hypothetical protein
MHSDSKKRRSSFLVALLFAAGDVRRWQGQGTEQFRFDGMGSKNGSRQRSKPEKP